MKERRERERERRGIKLSYVPLLVREEYHSWGSTLMT
jgi:hypothetical protein